MILPVHRTRSVRRGGLVTTALTTAAVLAGTSAAGAAVPGSVPGSVPSVESVTERVLQSVSVSMGPDGTTTGVGSNVVRAAGDVDDAESTNEAYAPQEVVGDLPVRVLTSWRTAEGAGTDLSDLQGYTGRVAIDLTVQNLTVEPQMLTYDTAGVSRRQAALVGSPLTVTASTSLGDLKPERVVTDDKNTGANITNGVLGKDGDGTTVQWAALLAPPTLSSAAELSLVVDAKDFEVPTIDLSVQPGLVTDPSIGALVDSAFNPAASEELDLQRRTIELINEVNVVLARASSTISDVRSSLTSSAETLGTRTVSDLKSSTESVTTNMGQLDGALQSLRGELNTTLESTGSSAVAELDAAVQTVDQLLGDTNAKVPTTAVRGNGCETTVAAPRQDASVYGNLLQVASQLDAYSRSTEACKGQLQASILKTIGPEEPTDALCVRPVGATEPRSLTCSLHETEKTFAVAAEALRGKLKEALALLEPGLYTGARDAANELIDTATGEGGVKEVIELIRTRRGDLVGALTGSYNSLKEGGAADAQLSAIEAGLTTVRDKAVEVRSQLGGDPTTYATSMSAQASAAAVEVCTLVAAGTLTPEEAAKTLGYLVPEATCASPTAPQGFSGPLTTRIGAQVTQLSQGIDSANSALAQVQALRKTISNTATVLDDVLNAPVDCDVPGDPTQCVDPRNLRSLFNALVGGEGEPVGGLFGVLQTQSNALDAQIVEIDELAGTVTTIGQGIDSAVNQALAQVGDGLAEGRADAVKAGELASADLGTMFERSSSGLEAAGATVVKNGKESVIRQKAAFGKARDESANRVSTVVEQGLTRINTGVASSTRDMEAATTLLTSDLRKVLLDLGERRVGGGGLLGSMATNAVTARTADLQLALAGEKTTSYANVRARDVDGLMLRQEQSEAAMQALLDLPAFQLDLPSGSEHRTVYSYTIGAS